MQNVWTTVCWLFEAWAVQKYVSLVDLVKSFPTRIYLQKSASIPPRASRSNVHVNSRLREFCSYAYSRLHWREFTNSSISLLSYIRKTKWHVIDRLRNRPVGGDQGFLPRLPTTPPTDCSKIICSRHFTSNPEKRRRHADALANDYHFWRSQVYTYPEIPYLLRRSTLTAPAARRSPARRTRSSL